MRAQEPADGSAHGADQSSGERSMVDVGDRSAGATRRQRIGCYGLAHADGDVLLVRIADGYPGAGRWTLPGGGLDYGEAPLDGLVREFGEETGLVPVIGRFLFVDSHHLRRDDGDELHLLRMVWQVMVPTGAELVVHEVDGSTDVARWIPVAELGAHQLLSIATRALATAGVAITAPDRSDGAV